MEKDKIIDYFGDVRSTARQFGISTQAVYAWCDPVSEYIALKADKLTKGKLKYRARDYNGAGA